MKRSTSWSRSAFVVLVGSLGMAPAMPLTAQSPAPCETDESYRALDFLLGEWRLLSGGDPDRHAPGGEAVGRSRVEKLENGCLIAETWAFADGRSGRTYSSYDAAAGLWRRFSVSNTGEVVRSSGPVEGGALLVRGERVSADGGTSNWRERLAPAAHGRISRVAGESGRGGRGGRAAVATFDGYYARLDEPAVKPPEPVETASREAARVEAEPPSAPAPAVEAPPASSEPAPEPQPAPAAGEVTADSARAADAANIERIAMESPMVLRLSLGAVEALPAGYAWITRDTAPYLCEGVTIEGLQVERRQRRGQVLLDVELAVHGIRMNPRVEIRVELRRPGQSSAAGILASGTASGRAGSGIPEQIEHGSVAFKAALTLEAEDFEAAVAGAERPELVITLAVEK